MKDYLLLVNKDNPLSEYYVPTDLVSVPTTLDFIGHHHEELMDRYAYKCFLYMQKEALKENYNILIDSAYRSFIYQKEILDFYINKLGINETEKLCAIPGESEHQTGLAVDIALKRNNIIVDSKECDPEIKWLKENSYHFGFILRYPLGKESVTGYNYEHWHYRFIGVNNAIMMHDSKIETLEEYVLKK